MKKILNKRNIDQVIESATEFCSYYSEPSAEDEYWELLSEMLEEEAEAVQETLKGEQQYFSSSAEDPNF